MNNFRTMLPEQRAPFQIGYDHTLLLIGSCFTENMGERLHSGKFQVATNPFGIVYNPVSIARCLHFLLEENRRFEEKDLFENAGLWHSWEHHGRFSKPDRAAALSGINDALSAASQHLKTTSRLLITLGTADVFTLRSTGQVVANNHKMPGALFEQRRLSVTEIVDVFLPVFEKLKLQTPDLQIVLTVSPVRHIRNGMIENQRSKATLLLACEQICRALPYAFYFPAYELQLDDLRDYRFYAADMLHPSEIAADYIWQFFCDTFLEDETKKLHARIEKIVTASLHRPFHRETPEHQAFIKSQLAAIEQLSAAHPALDFSEERSRFK